MKRFLPHGLLGLACLSLVLGCGSEPEKPAATSTGNGKPAETAKPDAKPADQLAELKGDVTLEVADWEEVQKHVAAHKGKVVVLDIWSNYCDPCLREFPQLVLLQRRYTDDVVAMSLNMNYAGIEPEPTEEQKEEALTFLKEKGAKFENFISSVPDEKFYVDLGVTSVPVVLVYDREGKLDTNFNNDEKKWGTEFTYEKHIAPRVKELVSKAAAAGR